MARLFIIGNGYDMERRGDTSYVDFRNWLIREYGSIYDGGDIDYASLNNLTGYGTYVFSQFFNMPKDDTESFKKAQNTLAAAVLLKCIEMRGNEWGEFENYLGCLPVSQFANEWEIYNKKMNLPSESIFLEPVSPEISKATSIGEAVPELFKEWIDCLKGTKPLVFKGPFEKNIIKNINDDDIFLIFNYLSTIEDLFNNYDSNIFYHIHGKAGDDVIVVGHGKNVRRRNLNTTKDYREALRESLKKDTDKIILNNNELWNKIRINSQNPEPFEIIEYGFSASKPDIPYVKKIIESIQSSDVMLRLNNYKDSGAKKEEKWRNNGYKGKIELYD